MYPERVKFDPRQFRWLGSALKENHVGLAWHTSPVQIFDDLFSKELIVAGTGGATNLYPVLTNAILGTKIKMIPGYQGTKQGMLAMERGEVAGNIGITWASLKATAGSWLRDGKIKVIIQYGLEKHPELPDVVVDLRLRQERRRPGRDGSVLRQSGIRPALHRAAGRAGCRRGRSCAPPSSRP